MLGRALDAPAPLVLTLALGIGACNGPAPTATPFDGFAIQLKYMADDELCPLASVPDVTFRINPIAMEQVTAVDPVGRRWQVLWAPGFQGGPAGDPVVRDPAGQIVLRDGEGLTIPATGQPTLHGHPVCAGREIYVFL